jgi:hypothetical protein
MERVLNAEEGVSVEAKEASLLEFHTSVGGGVDVLHPAVMGSSSGSVDMLLKHNNVGIWDFLGVHRRDDGSSSIVDRLHTHGGGR